MVRKASQCPWVYVTSRCYIISHPPPAAMWQFSPLAWLYQLPLFSSHSQLINKILNSMTTILEKTVSYLIEKDVSPPLLGAQRHEGGGGEKGGRCTIHRPDHILWHLFFQGANFSLGCQLEPAPLYSAWGAGERSRA